MVPLGASGVASTSVVLVWVMPTDVAAWRNRRFGCVGPSMEENQRSHTGNVSARPQ